MEHNKLTAGYARLDITPPLGTPIGGYFRVRITKGVLDPIYVRAVAFGEGEKSALLLVLDMVSLREGTEDGNRWSEKIAQQLGLPREAVFVCCTHSHTTPIVNAKDSHEMYDRWFFQQLCDAGRLAMDDRRPVLDIRGGQRDTEGLTYSRRYRMMDGAQMGNPPAKNWEEVLKISHPLGNVDRTMRLVRILRQDAPELVMLNFQSHPDCIGGEFISADFPGAVCTRLKELTGTACTVFLQGAQGNMVINNRMKPLPSGGIKNYSYAMAHGAKIAEAAMELYEVLPSVMEGGLSFGKCFVRGKTKRGTLPLDYCEDIVTRYKAGGLEAIDPNPKIATPIVAEAQQVWELEQDGLDYIDLPVTALRFGGVALAGIPGEPFSEIGRKIREGAHFPVTCTCCLTNGSFGYFPDQQAIGEGGYDTINTKLIKGTAEQLADTAVELLRRL